MTPPRDDRDDDRAFERLVRDRLAAEELDEKHYALDDGETDGANESASPGEDLE